MRYDYFAYFYVKAGDRKPRYCSPLGLHGRPSENEGFIEDPESDQGYLDYIKTDASEMDLQELTLPGYVSEVIDVLDSGIEFEHITIKAREIDIIDDEGTVPPCGFFIHGTFVEFGNTEPFSPVWFIDGDPYEANENTRRFRVPMKKLKDYFDVITSSEVQERLRGGFAKGNPWTFDQLKDYFESGIDDAVDLATRTFFGLRDLDGNPQILHALAVGMAGKTKNEMIVGFLHDVVEDSDTTLDDLRAYGFSEEVVAAIGLLTHDKKEMSYDDYIAKVASSGNMLAINVKVADLKHNILRGMIGGYEALVKKHEDALAAIKEYLVDEKR